jgi:dTDP-glucose pyrophosphorylase
MTEGAADTTLLASVYIDNDTPLLIANSDQFVECSVEDFVESSRNLDGNILTFKSTEPKWSYAKVENDRVVQVAEKNPISDNATVGIYYWKTGKDYVKYARRMMRKNIRVNNEFYVCPVFNEAIADGLHIGIKEVDKMWGLGTPEDLEYFINENHSPPWSN